MRLDELRDLASAGQKGNWEKARSKIQNRRSRYQLEMRRQRIPKLIVSDGQVFFHGSGPSRSEDGISGTPVSPGLVEGPARVIFDPRKADLKPGEILVCPGTDPAWTPLFLAAGGLVMEVGGLMTHGSVVAREYGIPAVVGVDEATTRIVNGMRLRVDGSHGTVEIIATEKPTDD